MSGTRTGSLKASQTNKLRHGADFYARIGAVGGRLGTTGGFAAPLRCDGSCDLDNIFGLTHKKAQCAGYKGGKMGRKDKTNKGAL